MSTCLLCGGKLGRVVYPFGTCWAERLFKYRKCLACASSAIDPLPTDDDFERMYRQDSYHDDFYGNLETEVTETVLPFFRGKLPQGATILDFGCGNGTFLRQVVASGFAAEGVELDPEVRRTASANSGCRVSSLDEIVAKGRKYDVIHLGDVLEHLPRPAELLRQLESLLAPGGMFFLEGPVEENLSLVHVCSKLFGLTKRALGRPVWADLPPYHLYRTTARAQRQFIERRMAYKVHHFIVLETGWPYLVPRASRPVSPAGTIKSVIGNSAKLVAKLSRPLGMSLGNRFAALASPGSPSP